MKYILLVFLTLNNADYYTATFDSKELCETAKIAIVMTTAVDNKNTVRAICVQKTEVKVWWRRAKDLPPTGTGIKK